MLIATILHTDISNKRWSDDDFKKYNAVLPENMRKKIVAYSDRNTRQLRITGKLLLLRQMMLLAPEKNYRLDDVMYDGYNKPSVNNEISFSLSYAGDHVFCVASIAANIGIDAEMICSVPSVTIADYFTENESAALKNSTKPADLFYELWTKKEAVLKASGDGIFGDFKDAEITGSVCIYKGEKYFLYHIPFNESCRISLATNAEMNIELKNIDPVI